MSLFYEHQSVWAANKWTTEKQKLVCLLPALPTTTLSSSRLSTAQRPQFEGLQWIWGSNVLLTLIFCQTSKVRLPAGACTGVLAKTRTERERGKPSKLGGVMKQKREWHSRGMWECVPTNLCLALWWMVSPWTWAARHPNTCGSISCQLHVLGLAQQSKRMTHSYFFKVEKIFEYYLHECAPWRHHAIAAFCRL